MPSQLLNETILRHGVPFAALSLLLGPLLSQDQPEAAAKPLTETQQPPSDVSAVGSRLRHVHVHLRLSDPLFLASEWRGHAGNHGLQVVDEGMEERWDFHPPPREGRPSPHSRAQPQAGSERDTETQTQTETETQTETDVSELVTLTSSPRPSPTPTPSPPRVSTSPWARRPQRVSRLRAQPAPLPIPITGPHRPLTHRLQSQRTRPSSPLLPRHDLSALISAVEARAEAYVRSRFSDLDWDADENQDENGGNENRNWLPEEWRELVGWRDWDLPEGC
ncbi:uncharacterized protein CTHT_0044800 [Thermochaetoides thermophila DSM 1495]|uniref:Uncharacterized protein n=1 Tax=Chaetomium thermophilum (strain DSM 1495 / CBS 144.50 / IMI 039719) TaxID=759272 RepID=G0S973_CHATD|nr:hypothetical protein CTHT_0044800 [Thermochaetoides thermophila DSM 1495]EGS19984.1 hypothetical protein CTHT_0044800 [Thermochaetoides thermophila DSM 1495]